MIKETETQLEKIRKQHAHWSSEHGHWEKNLRVWREQHQKAQKACENIQSLVKEFGDRLPALERTIKLHEEEVQLHTKELLLAKPGSKHPGDGLHACGVTDHQKEKDEHQALNLLQSRIFHEVRHLNSIFPQKNFRETGIEFQEETPRYSDF